MKYPLRKKTVQAIYDVSSDNNPLLEAIPSVIPKDDFDNEILSIPPLPNDTATISPQERLRGIRSLSALFLPMNYMYIIYETLYNLISNTYMTRTSIEAAAKINAIFERNFETQQYVVQAGSGSLLGVSGIGKTSAIMRCLSLFPQTIEHSTYNGVPFYCKQIIYLHVQCPSDCSIRTLALNIVNALDSALKCDIYKEKAKNICKSNSTANAYIKTICMSHNVGVIIIDEIQNVIITAKRNRQYRPLIKFLVELMNDTATAVYLVGTPEADLMFKQEVHLMRRTMGYRLGAMSYSKIFHDFMQEIWKYQFTPRRAELNEKMIKYFYDYTGGVPAYIIRLFQEAQISALQNGLFSIDAKTIRNTAKRLSFEIPSPCGICTPISEFNGVGMNAADFPVESECEYMETDAPALPVLPSRGRRPTPRDKVDLLVWRQDGVLEEKMEFFKMLEVMEGV